MRFQEPTKWEDFLDGFHNFWNCLDAYNNDSYWGRKEFWEWINLGFYRQYIYPYDDWYNPSYSKERRLRLAEKPPQRKVQLISSQYMEDILLMMIMDLLSVFNQTERRQISALSIINQNTLMQLSTGAGTND